MEKYLIHSNELHLIDAEKIHQATLKISRKGEKLIMYWESKKIDMN